MQKLVEGIHKFHADFETLQKKYVELVSNGQHPRVLFVTCSDSRIDLHLLTGTGPGELFVLRNAGNIIPPYGAGHGGRQPRSNMRWRLCKSRTLSCAAIPIVEQSITC